MADEGFLQRWSRRKAEARGPVQEREPASDPVAERADVAETAAPQARPTATDPRAQDEDAAVDLEALPDVDTLTYESDFTVFMRKGVPSELRKRALQRLWRSHPTLANLDGLLEYGEDYTKIGTAKQVVRTAYQVGRGMLGRIEAQAEGAENAPVERAGSEPAEPPPSARLPAPGGPDADQPAGEVPGERRAATADRQTEAPRPLEAGEESHAPPRGQSPRRLPRRG